MSAVKKIFNVLGILVSIVFSLILAAVLLVNPLMSAATALVQTDTLHGMIRQVDFNSLLPEGTGDEMTDALLQTEFVDDLLLLYVDDILAALDGNPQRSLNQQALAQLAVEHMDELIPIMRPIVLEMVKQSTELPDGISINWDELLTDEVIAAAVLQYLAENGEELLSQFPSPEDLGIDETVADAIALVRGGALMTGFTVLIAVLTVLILLCRWVRFKGFMWAGVVYLLCGLLDLAYAYLLKGIDIRALIADTPELAGVAPILLGTLVPALMAAAITIVVLGVVFVLIFIVGRIVLKKVKARHPVEAEELPAPEQDRFIPGQPEFMPSTQPELPAVEQEETPSDVL